MYSLVCQAFSLDSKAVTFILLLVKQKALESVFHCQIEYPAVSVRTAIVHFKAVPQKETWDDDEVT